jgi:hypothetical protein
MIPLISCFFYSISPLSVDLLSLPQDARARVGLPEVLFNGAEVEQHTRTPRRMSDIQRQQTDAGQAKSGGLLRAAESDVLHGRGRRNLMDSRGAPLEDGQVSAHLSLTCTGVSEGTWHLYNSTDR